MRTPREGDPEKIKCKSERKSKEGAESGQSSHNYGEKLGLALLGEQTVGTLREEGLSQKDWRLNRGRQLGALLQQKDRGDYEGNRTTDSSRQTTLQEKGRFEKKRTNRQNETGKGRWRVKITEMGGG